MTVVTLDLTEIRAKLAAVADKGITGRTEQFLLLRDAFEKIDEDVKAALKPLRDIKDLLEGYFDKFLTSTGQQTAVTSKGTVHWNTRSTASLEDPQAFMDFVIANQKFELIDRKANATAVKDYAADTGSLPPGVKVNTIRTVGVRVPSAKAKAKGA